jgi:hypothetical protein
MKRELQGDERFLFFTMMQAAIKMRRLGFKEENYVEFAKGIWEKLEMNNEDELEKIILDSMLLDFKDILKKEENL